MGGKEGEMAKRKNIESKNSKDIVKELVDPREVTSWRGPRGGHFRGNSSGVAPPRSREIKTATGEKKAKRGKKNKEGTADL